MQSGHCFFVCGTTRCQGGGRLIVIVSRWEGGNRREVVPLPSFFLTHDRFVFSKNHESTYDSFSLSHTDSFLSSLLFSCGRFFDGMNCQSRLSPLPSLKKERTTAFRRPAALCLLLGPAPLDWFNTPVTQVFTMWGWGVERKPLLSREGGAGPFSLVVSAAGRRKARGM